MSDHAQLSRAVQEAAGRVLSASTGAEHSAAEAGLQKAQRDLDTHNAQHSDD